MKVSARFPLVPVLALCAALSAAPVAAWAGGETLVPEPVVPFPGAAADDGGSATEAAPAALGATEPSPVAPGAPAAAGNETANAGADPGVPETASGPAPIGASAGNGVPAGGGAPQNPSRETEADTPAGGSRLLRMLAGTGERPGTPKAAASPDDPVVGAAPRSGTGVSGPGAFAAEGCPRALLRRLLEGAAGEADALSALGIEREILTLCRERQEILVGLFEAEAALRELSAPPPEAAAKPAAAASAPAPARQTVRVAQRAAPSPLRAALAAAAEEPKEAEPKAPRYAWFSIVGSAGALRAGVSDGSGVWFVREGDALPGGVRIAAIAGRPPGVHVRGLGETLVPESEAIPLPYRAPPGDGR